MCSPGHRCLLAVAAWATAGLAVAGAEPAQAQTGVNRVRNGGFEEGTAESLPGWETLYGRQVTAVDAAVAHSGTRSLRVFAPGGMRTVPIPYSGGRIRVSGWLRTAGIVTGSRPWYKAALQIISHDAAQKQIGHDDIALVDGTRDWTRYEGTTVLSRAVASVSVHCHIWGPDVKGTAWFDDVAMEFLDDPARQVHRLCDLGAATVTVDLGRDLGEFRHLWAGSDVAWFDRVTTPTQTHAMEYAKQFGFRYIRLHDCIHNPRVYAEDATGNPQFSWERFDRGVSAVTDRGLWPVLVLETMPPIIATADGGRNWTNPYPPKGADGYRKWQRINYELVRHCRAKWGEDIHNWYFEVWNEPESEAYFRGTLDEYLRIYDHAVTGATAADPGIRIGGPGGAGTSWCRAFLEHCRGGRNDATGQTGCRVDFLSWHLYTVGVGLPCFDNLRISTDTVRTVLADFAAYRGLPTLVTEWGCASSPHVTHDRPYDAAFRVMAVREFMDKGVTLALPFSLGEGPPHVHDGFQGGLALFTKTTIPKPSFRAFELLHRMVGRRVACESTNDPVDALACRSADGLRVWVMLYNLIEQYAHDPYETAVTVRLSGLPPGQWRCQSTAIAPGICDPFGRWQQMGSPTTLADDARKTLLDASQLPIPQPVEVQVDTLHVRVPGSAVVLLELAR